MRLSAPPRNRKAILTLTLYALRSPRSTSSSPATISAWAMAPTLFLVLMLGPIGFLLYLGVRALHSARRPAAARASTAQRV